MFFFLNQKKIPGEVEGMHNLLAKAGNVAQQVAGKLNECSFDAKEKASITYSTNLLKAHHLAFKSVFNKLMDGATKKKLVKYDFVKEQPQLYLLGTNLLKAIEAESSSCIKGSAASSLSKNSASTGFNKDVVTLATRVKTQLEQLIKDNAILRIIGPMLKVKVAEKKDKDTKITELLKPEETKFEALLKTIKAISQEVTTINSKAGVQEEKGEPVQTENAEVEAEESQDEPEEPEE